MLSRVFSSKAIRIQKIARGTLPLALILLLIEFFDELDYGIFGAALPALRQDLGLSYAQVGLLLGLPAVFNVLVEPILLLLGDTGLRKRLIAGGGLAVALSLFLFAAAPSFPLLLLASILGWPASGAFVTLSQATLMDLNPGREAQMIARWSVAGSLGNLIGPLIMAGGFALAFGWRWAFALLAGLAFVLTLLVLGRTLPTHPANRKEAPAGQIPVPVKAHLRELWANFKASAGNRRLWRWILLLELSDLMLDVFASYLPLYFTDVAGMTPALSGVSLSVLMLAGLGADLLLVPILERFPGHLVVRVSALISIPVYVAWLLVPWPAAKVAGLVLIRLTTLGWYPVLQGEAYATLPGQSGAVTAIGSVASLANGLIVWTIGWAASQVGLSSAMWLLLLGPLSLALFIQEGKRQSPPELHSP